MAETIKGLVVTIGGDTTALGKALADVNSKSRDIQSELRAVEKLLKLDPTNTELVAQKQKLLADAIATAAQKLNTLKAAQQQVNDQFARGDISEGQYRAFQRECAATEQQLKSLEKQLESTKKSFDLGDTVAKARSALKDAGSQLTSTGKALTTSLTVPIMGATAGLTALVTTTAQVGDELDEMAARTGFSVEALSEYKYAAGLAGVELDGLETAVKKMQNTITDAANGTKTAINALDQLGLSIQSLAGMSPEQQFDRIASAVAGIEDPTRRAALAQDVFGKSGTDLLPMLAEGSQGLTDLRQEARDLGIAWTGESAKAAAQFSDDLARVKSGVAGAFQGLAVDLIPIVEEKLVPAIEKHVIPTVRAFAEKIGELVDWFSNLDPKWQAVILAAVGFAAAIGPLLVVLGSLITGIYALLSPVGLVVVAIAAVIAIGVALATHWDQIKQFLANVWNSIKETAASVWNGIKAFFRTIWDGITWIFRNLTLPGILMSHWDQIKAAVTSVFSTVRDFLGGVWDSIKEKTGAVWNAIVGVIKAPINVIIGLINGLISAAEWMVNAVARAINSIPSIKIPDWVPFLGGATFSLPKIAEISLPKVPYLAEGAVFTGPSLAVIGEKEPEAALPLSKLQPMMTQALVDAIRELSAGTGRSGSTQSTSQEAVLMVDGARLARVLLPRLTAERQRLGIEMP